MCCQITPKWVVGSKGKPSNIQGFWAQIYLYFEFFLFGQISARTLTAHSLRSSHPHPFRTPCAHPHSVWVCCAQPHKYSGREKSKKEKKREKSISNPAIDRPRTAERITVQRTTRKLLLLSIGHVAVIYCLVFRDYLSGGALVAVPRLSLFSSSKSDYVVPGFFSGKSAISGQCKTQP